MTTKTFKSLPIQNRTIAQLKCLAPPNKFMGMDSKAKTLNIAYSIIHNLQFGWDIFLILNPEREHLTLSLIFSLDNRNVQFCLYTSFSNFFSFFFFCFTNLFHFCLLTVLWFWFKPSHCLPVTMWIYLSQWWNRANTSSFFVILESLNALSTYYVYFLFPLVTLHVFLYFCAFWKKTLLKEDFYLVKYEWRRGVGEFLTYHV